MNTHAHVMLGLPGENIHTIKKTIGFIKELDPTTATFGVCTPYPGTPLYKEVLEKAPELKDGSNIDLAKLHISGHYNQFFTDLAPKELENYIRIAYRSFYFRPNYIIKWLIRIKNINQIKRVVLAGTKIFQFGVSSGDRE